MCVTFTGSRVRIPPSPQEKNRGHEISCPRFLSYTLVAFMKKSLKPSRTVIFLAIGIMLVFLSTAFGFSSATSQSATPSLTPLPTEVDITLEVGSTDGILIWAVLITLIIVVPVVWNLLLATQKKK